MNMILLPVRLAIQILIFIPYCIGILVMAGWAWLDGFLLPPWYIDQENFLAKPEWVRKNFKRGHPLREELEKRADEGTLNAFHI